MLKSLYWKLTLAFVLVALVTAGLVALFIRLTNADRLTQLIQDQQRSSLQTALTSYYTTNGSWSGIEQNWQQVQTSSFPPASAQGGTQTASNRPPGDHGPRSLFGLADTQGNVLISANPNEPVGMKVSANVLKAGTPITVNGTQVGTILANNQPPGFNPQETQFLNRTNEALVYAMLGALALALLIGVLLSRALTHPLQALTRAAQSITRGQLEQQVKVNSNDELGQLAVAFNRMSQEVSRVNLLRRQMTADIAHDLRTPLTVISGYIESMRDGVLKPTPQRLSLIYSEIERLQNLVGDLRMLSMADAGELPLNPQDLSPQALLERTASLFRHQAEQQGVTIHVRAGEDLPAMRVDEARMMQVMGNLISNSLRYTPEGGKIMLSAASNGTGIEIDVEDTGSGIAEEELPYIFDRFHRADKSRHSETGESGLGLAIVKALVESHGGSVTAESAAQQGTIIHLKFPQAQAAAVGAALAKKVE
ncbi:MAG TPA: ATP-binding protein [Anaerolineaceae bacterium]